MSVSISGESAAAMKVALLTKKTGSWPCTFSGHLLMISKIAAPAIAPAELATMLKVLPEECSNCSAIVIKDV